VRQVKYEYTEIIRGAQASYRPMVDVLLLAPNGEAVERAALADSGADFCLFPLSTAKMLGLPIENLPTAITVGVGNASNVTYFDYLTIDLGNGIIFTTQVGFTEGMSRVGFGLLGQQGFLEN
jgi:hypothetical protein